MKQYLSDMTGPLHTRLTAAVTAHITPTQDSACRIPAWAEEVAQKVPPHLGNPLTPDSYWEMESQFVSGM